jgi:hypothetical protein
MKTTEEMCPACTSVLESAMFLHKRNIWSICPNCHFDKVPIWGFECREIDDWDHWHVQHPPQQSVVNIAGEKISFTRFPIIESANPETYTLARIYASLTCPACDFEWRVS